MKILKIFTVALVGALTSCGTGEIVGLYDVTHFGAKGDGITDDAAAIQDAINRCTTNGGGTVYFPSGKTFLAGPFHVASNVDMHLGGNSRLVANPDESLYTESAFGANRGEGMMWISGRDISNFSISGTGTIDGNGVSFMGKELDDSYELKPVTDFDPRPHVLTLINAQNVRIKDVTFTNSAYWTVHLVGCYDVAVTDISLRNNLKIRNGDGIDVDHSRKVRITGCLIESGDDCICLKNRREYQQYGPCSDIVVTNCIMTSRSCAVKIGSENMDSIDNVLFSNCTITKSNRGIGIQNRDEGTVSNVSFSNMTVDCRLFSDVWWGKSEPIYVTSYPRAASNNKDGDWRFPEGATQGRSGAVNRIRFNNITCTSENGIFLGCDTPGKVSDIRLDNIEIRFDKVTDYPGGVYDRRPCEGAGFVESKTYGVYAEKVADVSINGFKAVLDGFPTDKFGGYYHFVDCSDMYAVPANKIK